MTRRGSSSLPVIATLAVALVALATGCPSTPDPAPPDPTPIVPPLPPLAVRVLHFPGSPLSGPVDGFDPVGKPGEDDALAVLAVVWVLEHPVDDRLPALSASARVVLRADVGHPLAQPPRATRHARYEALQDAAAMADAVAVGELGPARELVVRRGALLRGTTVAFEIGEREGEVDPTSGASSGEGGASDAPAGSALVLGDPSKAGQRITVAVHRPAHDVDGRAIGIGITLSGPSLPDELPARPAHEGDRVRLDPRSAILESAPREIVLTRPIGDASGAAVAIPSTFPCAPDTTILVVVGIGVQPLPGEPGHEDWAPVLADCRTELVRRGARATMRRRAAERGTVTEARIDLGALAATESPRRALFGLARSTGATLVEEVALTAGDEIIRDAADRVVEAVAERPPASDAAARWTLERETIAALATASSSEDAEQSASARAVLIRHTGGVGLRTVTLTELLLDGDEAATRGEPPDLGELLIAANRDLLADGSPAVRVRAHEWLLVRDVATEGFDPLASPEARRTALAKPGAAVAAPTDGPTEGGAP